MKSNTYHHICRAVLLEAMYTEDMIRYSELHKELGTMSRFIYGALLAAQVKRNRKR